MSKDPEELLDDIEESLIKLDQSRKRRASLDRALGFIELSAHPIYQIRREQK